MIDSTVRADFKDATAARGLIIRGEIVADGNIKTCDVEAPGNHGKGDGRYQLYPDYPVNGWFQNWRDGLAPEKWRGNGSARKPSAEEMAEWEARRKRREEAERQAKEKVSRESQEIWARAGSPSADHPYLLEKGIGGFVKNLRADESGKILLVPLQDTDGKIWNLQRIDQDGNKLFPKGGRVKGLYFASGPKPEPGGIVVIAEGMATATSTQQATKLPVAAAMFAGNLLPVGKAIRDKFPKARIVYFADNDANGVGLKAAKEAATATGGIVVMSPTMHDDANDLFVREGAEAVKALVDAALAETTEEKDLPSASKWPAPPDKVAFSGLAGEFVRLVEPATEGDPVAILAQFLVMVGNMLGRGPYVPVEADRHYTNLFSAIVGVTSKGRKGISAGRARAAMADVDVVWVQDRMTGGLSSGEGLIWGVRDPIEKQEAIRGKGKKIEGYQTVVDDPGVTDKRLMVMDHPASMGQREHPHADEEQPRQGDGRPYLHHRTYHEAGVAPLPRRHREGERIRQPLPLGLREAVEVPPQGRKAAGPDSLHLPPRGGGGLRAEAGRCPRRMGRRGRRVLGFHLSHAVGRRRRDGGGSHLPRRGASAAALPRLRPPRPMRQDPAAAPPGSGSTLEVLRGIRQIHLRNEYGESRGGRNHGRTQEGGLRREDPERDPRTLRAALPFGRDRAGAWDAPGARNRLRQKGPRHRRQTRREVVHDGTSAARGRGRLAGR